MKKIGLLPRLLIGIVVGILVGLTGIEVINRIFVTFSGIFANFLSYIIPLIILGFVVPGIAELGGKAGRLLGLTAGIAYISTVAAGLWSFAGTRLALPFIVGEVAEVYQGRVLEPFFAIEFEPIMGVMTALITAFILGLGIAATKGKTMFNFMQEFQGIIKKVIERVFIPFLPIHIAGLFAHMAYSGEIAATIGVYGAVFVLALVLHYAYITAFYGVAGAISGQNPFRAMKAMFPAYTTAIGTQSSAATIPVTLQSMKRIDRMKEKVAEFVAPLCATIHLSGSTISLVACAIAVLALDGQTLSFTQAIGFIMMLGVTMVAAPGVPGGAVVAALGLLETMLGFTEAQMGVMIAIYVAQDSFGTAANVWGDGAIGLIVNKFAGKSGEAESVQEEVAS